MDGEALRRIKKNVEIDAGGCWLWKASKKGEYGSIRYKGKSWLVHRLAFVSLRGNVPDGHYVCHECDIKLCCNPDHLTACTPSENRRQAYERGTPKHFFGLANCNGKLTDEQHRMVEEFLKRKNNERGSIRFLARWFGVTPSCIGSIKSGRRKGAFEIDQE